MATYSSILSSYSLEPTSRNIINGNFASVIGLFPTGTVVGTSDTQTLTNKTLTSPKVNENVAVTATATELNYSVGVTSAIQTQLGTKAPLASPTFTGTVTLPTTTITAGSQIKYTIPTSAGTTGAMTNEFNSGYSSTAVGDLVYLDSSSTWQKCDADLSTAAEAGLIGIALSVTASGAAATVALSNGLVFATAWNLATVGAPVYMSATAGAITLTAPTTTDSATRIIGWVVASGNGTTKIWFKPSPDYFTHV